MFERESSKKGFTLIELLVAASILGLIGLVILTTFGSGFHVYERIQVFGMVQTDALLALEEMEKNIRSTFSSSVIGFQGDAHSIAFPILIETVETLDDEEKISSSIGQITYYLQTNDSKTKMLMSRQKDYSRAVAEIETGENDGNTLAFIDGITFSYFFFDVENQVYDWKNSWNSKEDNLPAGVKIELTFKDGGRDVQLVRMADIPTVRRQKKEEQEEGQGDDDV